MSSENSQIPLDLPHKPSFAMEDFVVSSSNEAAYRLIDGWPEWPLHAVALVGPSASGKTHLGHAWAKAAGARRLDEGLRPDEIEPGASYLVEDADRGQYAEDMLFHLYNWTRETGGHVLFTARTAPNIWSVALPDLRSRLATLPVAEIHAPDDQLLMVVLVKMFSDRQLQVDLSVIDYIVKRMERSFTAAQSLVADLDAAALAGKRRITRALAKACLDGPSDR